MELDVYQPSFVVEIEGRRLSRDITREITSFAFEDNEDELDVMEVSITDRNLQFVDEPLFQEGNEITARFGYADNLSPKKVAVIKEIDYDFPDGGEAQYPIWSGVWLAGSNPGEMPEEAKRLCLGSECSGCPDASEHAKSLQDNLEHRKYHTHPPYWCPKVYMLAKTPAGHVVLLDDRESDACIRIADSSGQEITLVSGRKVEITDRAGSRITMDAESGDITIASVGMVHINP